MFFSKRSLSRKLFSFLSFFSILSQIFQPFALAYLVINPSQVHASESTLSLSYNSSNHTLGLGSENTYSLYYQADDTTEAVYGTGSSIYLGSASSEAASPDNLVRGIIKTNSDTHYFVRDGGSITTVLTLPTLNTQLADAEQSWLNNPNTFSDLRVGSTYHAPFNSDFFLTFTTLPSNPGSITFNQITLTPEQMQLSGALTSTAYELTSTMEDGSFTYTLTLPNPSDSSEVGIQYSEDGLSFESVTSVTSNEDNLVATNLNHFTIFVISGIQNNPAVRINEFVYNPSSGSEWIELYNSENTAVSVANWQIRDASGNSTTLSGSIPPHGYLVVNVNFLNNTGSNLDGDTITLRRPIIFGLYQIIDQVTYYRSPIGLTIGSDNVSSNNQMLGMSIGRATDGGSDWNSYTTPTPGYSNLGDPTAPIITYTITPSANAAGWNNSDVTVSWIYTDPDSPIFSHAGCDTSVVSAEGKTTLTCTVTSGHPTPASSTFTINLDKTAPSAPSIIAPTAEQFFKTTPISNEWSTLTDLSGIAQYRVEYAYDDGHTFFDAPYRYTTTNSRNHVPGIGEQGGVKFRVQGLDNAGNEGEWSEWRHYTYDATAPSNPGTPVDNVSNPTNQTFITWAWTAATDTLSGVKNYIWNLWKGMVKVKTDTTTSTSQSVDVSGYGDGEFSFDVQAEDNSGNKSGVVLSEIVTVDTLAPTVTYSESNPADGLLTNNNDQVFGVTANESVSNCTLDFGSISTATTRVNWHHSYPEDTRGSWYFYSPSGRSYSFVDRYANAGTGFNSFVSPVLYDMSSTFSGDMLGGDWYLQMNDHVGADSGAITSIDLILNGVSHLWTGSAGVWDYHTTTVTIPVTGGAGGGSYPMAMVGGNNQQWSVLVSDMADGKYSYTVSCVDLATNVGESTSRSLTVDTQAPVLSSQTTYSGWYSEDQTSEFVYTDENGIASGSPASCLISTEGENQTCSVTPDVVDNAGNHNTTPVTSNGANIDKFAPVIELTFDPTLPDASNNWYKTQPSLTLTVTDVNPDIAEYQWGGTEGEWTLYDGSFKPATEGAYKLYYRALDKSGKYSEVGMSEVKWDATKPSKGPQDLSVSPNPTSSDKSKVSWKATTDNVGISYYEIQWRKDGVTHTSTVGSDVFEKEIDQLTEGSWNVLVRAYDFAGNTEEVSTTLTVDRTSPSAPNLTLLGTGVGTASLAWTAVSDAKSYTIWYGTSSGSYIYGANVGNINSYTVQGLGAGTYYFVVKATDNSGNGSSYSNEVSTGAITGAPGVAPGTPAEGFTPEPAVLGDQTGASNTTETADVSGNMGEILGQTRSRTWLWWIIPLILFVLYIIYRRFKNKK